MKNSFGSATFEVGDDFASAAATPPKTGMKREAIHELSRVRVVRAGGGGKDRHSKVCTARGTRDRRVRLSPKTAILFYDVQDRLGYDRPSKAIDWLIKEAKSAIDALHDPSPTPNDHSSYAPPLDTKNDAHLFSAFAFNNEAITEAEEGYRHQFLSAPTPLELFDANPETSRFPAEAAADHHMFLQSQREPLQSSYSGINSINSPQFHGGFSYSLPSFCVEDEMDYVPLLNKSSSSAISFLDYEE